MCRRKIQNKNNIDLFVVRKFMEIGAFLATGVLSDSAVFIACLRTVLSVESVGSPRHTQCVRRSEKKVL